MDRKNGSAETREAPQCIGKNIFFSHRFHRGDKQTKRLWLRWLRRFPWWNIETPCFARSEKHIFWRSVEDGVPCSPPFFDPSFPADVSWISVLHINGERAVFRSFSTIATDHSYKQLHWCHYISTAWAKIFFPCHFGREKILGQCLKTFSIQNIQLLLRKHTTTSVRHQLLEVTGKQTLETRNNKREQNT